MYTGIRHRLWNVLYKKNPAGYKVLVLIEEITKTTVVVVIMYRNYLQVPGTPAWYLVPCRSASMFPNRSYVSTIVPVVPGTNSLRMVNIYTNDM